MSDRVIGFLRFSVVTDTHKEGYRSTRNRPTQEALQTILAPSRLAQRLKLFQTMPLASLAAQTDKDFEIKLVTSEHLPHDIKSALYDLAATHAFLEISELPVNASVGEHFRSFVRTGERTITFRIDDDDALNPEHIADLRTLAAGKDERVLTSPNGIYVQPEGDMLLVERVHYPSNAFGIGYVSTSGNTIWSIGNHSQIPTSQMEQHPRKNAWIRSTHAGSDSGARVEGGGKLDRYLPGDLATMLPEYDYIDFNRLHAELGDAPTEVKTAGLARFRARVARFAARLAG